MNSESLSPSDLLKACLAGDSRAWCEFLRRYQPVIAGTIWKTLKRYPPSVGVSRELVDDLVQQSYLRLCAHDFRALRNIELRHENALPAYLRAVASSVAVDHVRDKTPQSEPIIDSLISFKDRSPDQDLLLRDIDRQLRACSESVRDRSVFWMYYRDGMTAKDISGLAGLGLSQKGVESVILRLTRCIKKEMGEGFSDRDASYG